MATRYERSLSFLPIGTMRKLSIQCRVRSGIHSRKEKKGLCRGITIRSKALLNRIAIHEGPDLHVRSFVIEPSRDETGLLRVSFF